MMQPIRITGVYVSLWVALTLSAAARAVVSADAPQAMLSIVFWAVVLGGGLWYARTRDGAPPKTLVDGIAAIGLGVCVLQLFLDGILQALLSLLLWLQAARSPALKARRDAYFALCISLVLVVFGASEARSSAFVVLLAAYGLSALAVLVYCHQQAGLEREQPAVTSAAGGNVKSFPLAHLVALSVCVFLVAMSWYLLVPRPDPIHFAVLPTRGGEKYSREDWEHEARYGNVPQRGAASNTGRGSPPARQEQMPDESLDITRSGQGAPGVDPNAIVMYVQSDRPLYLRGRSFDRFEKDRWSRSDTGTRKLVPEDDGWFKLSSSDEGVKVEYLAHVVSLPGSVLPLSAHAVALAAPASVIAAARDGAVFLPAPAEPGFRYGATSLLPRDQPRPVARDVPGDRSPYLQLPEGFSSRIGELAGRVGASAASPLGKAVALETHLRSAYAYSFETVFTSQGVTPLEEFLFDTRRGHCEFFASAMAVMLRAIGIPSRVVRGYLAQNFNPVTGFYEVRAFDGHAWVEAHIDGVGWMTFEPTAAYPIPQREQQTGTTLFDLKTYTERLSLQEALQGKTSITATVAALFRRLAEAWHALVFQLRTWFDSLTGWIVAYSLPLAAALIAVAAGGVLAYRQRVRLLWLWARVVLFATPRAKVPLTAFRQLERVAGARNLGRLEGETVEEYLDRLEMAYVELHAELHRIARAFNASRYGDQTPSSAEADDVLRAFLTIGMRLNAG